MESYSISPLEQKLNNLIAEQDGILPEEVTLEYIRRRRGNCDFHNVGKFLYEEAVNGSLFCTKVTYQDYEKTLYTVAHSYEEAGQKFHRHMVCQWIGYPFDSPETLLEGVFDKIEDGAFIA
jgi:hypothetical protein